MNKKGQVSFSQSDFTNSVPTENIAPKNLFQRIIEAIVMIVFILVFTPILVALSESLLPSVCVNAITCIFFRFIVPAFVIGGIIACVKYVWDRQQ